MNKEKSMKKLVEAVALKIALRDANTVCPFITYQPTVPKSVKKLRKF